MLCRRVISVCIGPGSGGLGVFSRFEGLILA